LGGWQGRYVAWRPRCALRPRGRTACGLGWIRVRARARARARVRGLYGWCLQLWAEEVGASSAEPNRQGRCQIPRPIDLDDVRVRVRG
jgi:hypothetical protein